MKTLIRYVVITAIAFVYAWSAAQSSVDAECTTDTECMALCPVDDLDCDGGPQS